MCKREKRVGRVLFICFLLVPLCLSLPMRSTASPGREKRPEMTPGPRMIRTVEALAHDTLSAGDTLVLTPDQVQIIQTAVTDFKKDIWRKEAVLLGMFEKISLKRRHGLLVSGDYKMANQLTGGIESDEMGRMIRAVKIIQGSLSPGQLERFQFIRKPKINLNHPEGFNTRIGLLALGRIGRAYGQHREKLGLSESQKISLRNLLNASRREIIEIGTQIEISRMEAYDLLKEPLIDAGIVQEAMERTAKLEGIFFPKLSEYSKKYEEILTPEQQALMKEPRKMNPHASLRHKGSRQHAALEENPSSLLNQAKSLGLSRGKIEQLLELELSVVQELRSKRVEQKIEKLLLDEKIKSGASEKEITAHIDQIVKRTAEIEKIQLENHAAGLKILKGHQKVTFHRSGSEGRD